MPVFWIVFVLSEGKMLPDSEITLDNTLDNYYLLSTRHKHPITVLSKPFTESYLVNDL